MTKVADQIANPPAKLMALPFSLANLHFSPAILTYRILDTALSVSRRENANYLKVYQFWWAFLLRVKIISSDNLLNHADSKNANPLFIVHCSLPIESGGLAL